MLRSRTTAEIDELGQTYRTTVWGVDPTTGTVSTGISSNFWYDRRGNLVKTAAPGGLVTKTQFDGANRAIAAFASDGGGDSSWADALTVTGDTVLSQTEWTLDKNGNAILTTSREQFHDASGTGGLGSPSSGIPARASYQVAYFDAADRAVATGDYGTNGGEPVDRVGTDLSSFLSPGKNALKYQYAYGQDGLLSDVTDPKGIVSHSEYDDFGRIEKSVENYKPLEAASATVNKTTLFGYGPAGPTSQTSVNPGSASQTTEFVYGVSTGSGSAANSNDVSATTRWPDPTSGTASAGEQETSTINALGQTLTRTDRNGTTHAYSYDVLGRLIADTATVLGASVDGSVRRIEYGYDGQGNLAVVTSFDAVAGGSITNQVKREFNKFGQMTVEWQQHGGAVTGSSPKVVYSYTEGAGSTNESRLTQVTYPSLYQLNYNYASGLDASISRLSSLSDSTGTLETYAYMGVGTVVVRGHPQTGVDLSYVKQGAEPIGEAGDQYTGLDRFGRVVDQRWLDGGVDVEWRHYEYDANSNRTSAANLLNGLTDLYGYDGLNQLTSFERRPDVGAPNRVIDWDYDALGNWNGVEVDGVTEAREHNAQNEITGIGGGSPISYDENGNTIVDDRGQQLVYDAWNRLVQIFDDEANLVREFTYDGFGRRDTVTDTLGTTALFYSDQWQVLEETVGGAIAARYVWSPAYVDALVVRERGSDTVGTLDERLWAVHDANWNVVALVDDSGAVVERMAYDPYGAVTILNPDFSLRSGGTQYAWTVLFQGMAWDADAGMYGSTRMRGSGYSPTLGRWLSNDPGGYDMGDPNLYRFVGNDPVGEVDPWGLQPPAKPVKITSEMLLEPKPLTREELEQARLESQRGEDPTASPGGDWYTPKRTKPRVLFTPQTIKGDFLRDFNSWVGGRKNNQGNAIRLRMEAGPLYYPPAPIKASSLSVTKLASDPFSMPDVLTGKWELSMVTGGDATSVTWWPGHAWIELHGAEPSNANQHYTINSACFPAGGFADKWIAINEDDPNLEFSRRSRVLSDIKLLKPNKAGLNGLSCAGYAMEFWSLNVDAPEYIVPLYLGYPTAALSEQVGTTLQSMPGIVGRIQFPPQWFISPGIGIP